MLGQLLIKTFVTETQGAMSPQNNRRSGYFPGKNASILGLFRAFPRPNALVSFHPHAECGVRP